MLKKFKLYRPSKYVLCKLKHIIFKEISVKEIIAISIYEHTDVYIRVCVCLCVCVYI